MTHEEFKKFALDYYTARRHADMYLFGWENENGDLMIVRLAHLPIEMVGITKESGYNGLRLRLRANKRTLSDFNAHAENIGAWSKWVDEYHKRAPGVKKDNRGDIVECAIRLFHGYEWTRQGNKSSTPFTQGADVIIDGIEYEIKTQESTLIAQSFIERNP